MIARFGVFLALLLMFASTSMAADERIIAAEEEILYPYFAAADQEALVSIFISEVSTPEPAWLLVHDSEDGELVETLGATYLAEGVHENVPIFMKVPEDGTMDELALVMHSDKGELGVLDEHDIPIENVDQKLIKLHDSLIIMDSEDEEAERSFMDEEAERSFMDEEAEESGPFPWEEDDFPIYYVR